ncbi:type IX secretion system protein PorG [Mucilaginibacter myungsuensis]|uniref:Outer membrane beta-barrel protein n=1 Tax=Mucilaginibacter myungsuensis TaxID=649104 RepID=A0A929PW64_9SPHI|nr:DUF6089 family protein [Mucilaginibacter myungsuensis]MBE9661834.1 outer membrane beta-barrel protein [Mucilaginibacter myungsuensis]MDN3599732.1 DUF6089 family protein [Mucilaginibacter myungsuensis]
MGAKGLLINVVSKTKSSTACRYLLFTFYLLIFTSSVNAQTWEGGFSAGGAGYIGEMNQTHPLKPSGLAGGIFVQRNFTPHLSAKLNFALAEISGADSLSNNEQSRQRNLSFRTPLNELTLQLDVNFMRYTPGAAFNHFSPYIFFGAGIANFKPTTTYQGAEYNLRDYTTEGVAYKASTLVIPYGVGLKYNFSSSWNIMANLGYRYVKSDYLDDVSTVYRNRIGLSPLESALSDRSGERTGSYIGVPGSMRGDNTRNDIYMFVGFSVSFTFLTANCYY